MTDTVNTRRLALDVLLEVTEHGAYSNQVLRAVLEKYQYMEKYERAFLTRLVEGTIQHMIELDYVIDQFSKVKVKKMKPVIRNILRMGVYQIQYMDSVPDSAACNEAVKLARKSGFSTLSGFVNGVLRNIARNSGSIRYPDEEKEPVLALSVRYSMPEWIVEEWLNAYGMEQTKAILDAFSKEAPITIRTNVTKITPDALKEQLKAEGVTVQTLEELSYAGLPYTDAYHYAFAISGFDHLMALPSFQDGLFYVQDISSMMVAEAAAPEKGAHVIDVCAAPGGKSIHLAEMLDGTGSVESRDLTGYKTGLIEENISRYQIKNMTTKVWDATVPDESAEDTADVLVADLPCSGLGGLRKKTDIRYKMSRGQQEELEALQRRILDTDIDGLITNEPGLVLSTKYYKNTIVGYSFSKSLSLPGERIGYVVVPNEASDAEELIRGIEISNRTLGFVNAPSLIQKAVARCLDEKTDVSFYDENRTMLYDGLTELGFTCIKPEGAFYLWVKSPVDNEEEFVEEGKKLHLLMVKGSAFGCGGFVRLAYCVSHETVKNSLPAFEKLAQVYGLK